MFLNNQLKEIENFVNSSANKKRSSRAFHSTIPEQGSNALIILKY